MLPKQPQTGVIPGGNVFMISGVVPPRQESLTRGLNEEQKITFMNSQKPVTGLGMIQYVRQKEIKLVQFNPKQSNNSSGIENFYGTKDKLKAGRQMPDTLIKNEAEVLRFST